MIFLLSKVNLVRFKTKARITVKVGTHIKTVNRTTAKANNRAVSRTMVKVGTHIRTINKTTAKANSRAVSRTMAKVGTHIRTIDKTTVKVNTRAVSRTMAKVSTHIRTINKTTAKVNSRSQQEEAKHLIVEILAHIHSILVEAKVVMATNINKLIIIRAM